MEISTIFLILGVSIAVKQVMPDHVLARTPVGKITNRNIPLTVFGLTFIMWAIGKTIIPTLEKTFIIPCRYG